MPTSEVSTDDGYGDPNGRMHDYGDKKYGLTGTSDGWRHDYVKLGGFAGQNIKLRLRYATDEAFQERGWFADDFSVTGGGATAWSDDAETDGDWVATVASFRDTTGAGWHRDSGTTTKAQYYLAEWRNFDGFDKGLQYTYDSTYLHDAWKVEKIKYNAPGMLVWYRDTTYGNDNLVTANTTALPSAGSKGGLLLVDSHFDPFRRQGEAADKDPSTLNNLPSRPQSSNIAFGLQPTYPFRECYEALPAEPFSEYCTDFGAQAPVSKFTDTKGWYPGIEVRPGRAVLLPRRRRVDGRPVGRATPRTARASSTRTATRCPPGTGQTSASEASSAPATPPTLASPSASRSRSRRWPRTTATRRCAWCRRHNSDLKRHGTSSRA